jgi:hypothetical protein
VAIDATFEMAMGLERTQSDTSIDHAGLENARLQRVIDSLPDNRYARALAIGASPALQRKLNRYCDSLATNPDAERIRSGRIELMIVCDALFGASAATLAQIAEQCVSALQPGGHLVLVNWLDADNAAAAMIAAAGDKLLPVSRQRTPHYRVDVLERA